MPQSISLPMHVTPLSSVCENDRIFAFRCAAKFIWGEELPIAKELMLADKISESTVYNLRISICMMLIQHMRAAVAQTELSVCVCILHRTEADLDKKKTY